MHYGLKEGLFEIVLDYQIGFGPVGPKPEEAVPGMMLGLTRIGLARARSRGPQTIDAAEVWARVEGQGSLAGGRPASPRTE